MCAIAQSFFCLLLKENLEREGMCNFAYTELPANPGQAGLFAKSIALHQHAK